MNTVNYRAQVQVPGIIICVISGLSSLMFTVTGFIGLYETITGHRVLSSPNDGAPPIVMAIVCLALAAFYGVVVYGGIQLARLQSRGWGIFSSVVMLIPCTGPCCLIGIPLGIWALVTMHKVPLEAWGGSASTPPDSWPQDWGPPPQV